jgi:hypothetical protein
MPNAACDTFRWTVVESSVLAIARLFRPYIYK